MPTKAMKTVLAALGVTLAAGPLWAGTWDGTVKLGGTIMNQTGDRSAVQETYNIYDGFTVTQVHLTGVPKPGQYVMLDVRDANQASRQGEFLARVPGKFKLTAGYDEGRQIFDPARGVNAIRKDWKGGLQVTPQKGLALSGNLNVLTREGDRLTFPAGTLSSLSSEYDNRMVMGDVTAELQRGRRGGAVSFRMSDYLDRKNDAAARRGEVVSARLYAPSWFYDKWTHLVRGAYGQQKLENGGIDHTFTDVQYTGIVQPVRSFQFKYNFAGDRVDDQATRLKTDRFQNDVDLAWFHKYGQLTGGYGYEINDDDRSLTSYDSWRVGGTFHYLKRVNAKVSYDGRVKKDQEDLTLLKDMESSQVRAKLELIPVSPLTVGGTFAKRERDLTDIRVTVDGKSAGGYVRYALEPWGSVSADYTFADDEYRDLAGRFHATSSIVTSRVETHRIRNLQLAGGVTYLTINQDLDIEKSMAFAEGSYALGGVYHLEVKYNVYNYDDYILLNRYYTANVLRINLAYDFHAR